nr:homoserine dehydrogenase [uncultured Acetatifactor sp.]
MINIAVLGYGVVGSGVVEVIGRNHEEVRKKAGDEVRVKYILDLRDFPGDPYEDCIIHDFDIILNDPEVSIVCEVMGGTGAAYQFTRQLLEAGKNVCTSNKELVAKHGAEFLELAVARHCNYMFEASVGGGIPIIRSVNTALTAEKIEAVTAILNGTTNYILTKMGSEGTEYEEALKQAQELGYAERNPEADVEGYDACRKLAILSSLITGRNVDAGEIYTEGITGITGADFEYARLEGMVIKQLAIGKMQEDGSVLAMVAPFMLSAGYPLAAVNDVFNAVLVTGNMLGDVIFYGRGAGKLPTASAVAADVIDCAKHQGKNVICIWDREAAKVADVADTKRRFFLRVDAEARGAVEEMFAGGKIVTLPAGGEELGFFTAEMKEKDFNAKCGELGTAVLSRIRLL